MINKDVQRRSRRDLLTSMSSYCCIKYLYTTTTTIKNLSSHINNCLEGVEWMPHEPNQTAEQNTPIMNTSYLVNIVINIKFLLIPNWLTMGENNTNSNQILICIEEMKHMSIHYWQEMCLGIAHSYFKRQSFRATYLNIYALISISFTAVAVNRLVW